MTVVEKRFCIVLLINTAVCCFICDRKQQDQAERKKYRYSDEGDLMFLCPVVGPLFFWRDWCLTRFFPAERGS